MVARSSQWTIVAKALLKQIVNDRWMIATWQTVLKVIWSGWFLVLKIKLCIPFPCLDLMGVIGKKKKKKRIAICVFIRKITIPLIWWRTLNLFKAKKISVAYKGLGLVVNDLIFLFLQVVCDLFKSGLEERLLYSHLGFN